MPSKNDITFHREFEGRSLIVRAAYVEHADDWNVVLFEGAKILDARTTSDPWADARDMVEAVLESPETPQPRFRPLNF